MSSRTKRYFSGSRAAVGMDELFVLVIVIVLFSSAMAFSFELVELSQRKGSAGDIFQMADEISKQVRSHPRLIVENQPGLFDERRLLELDNESLAELINIPGNCGFSIAISDLSDDPCPLFLNFTLIPDIASDRSTGENAVATDPVNIWLNDHEVHAAVLAIGIWR